MNFLRKWLNLSLVHKQTCVYVCSSKSHLKCCKNCQFIHATDNFYGMNFIITSIVVDSQFNNHFQLIFFLSIFRDTRVCCQCNAAIAERLSYLFLFHGNGIHSENMMNDKNGKNFVPKEEKKSL